MQHSECFPSRHFSNSIAFSILTVNLSPELKGSGPDAGVGGNPEREVCFGTLLRLQNTRLRLGNFVIQISYSLLQLALPFTQ